MQLKPKVEIRTLFERIGYNYKPGKFNAIFNRSVVYTKENLLPGQQIAQDHTTVRGMMLAIQDLDVVE